MEQSDEEKAVAEIRITQPSEGSCLTQTADDLPFPKIPTFPNDSVRYPVDTRSGSGSNRGSSLCLSDLESVMSLQKVKVVKESSWDKVRDAFTMCCHKMTGKSYQVRDHEFMSRYESRVDYDVDVINYDWSKATTWPFWRDFVIDGQSHVMVMWMGIVALAFFYNISFPFLVTIFMRENTPWHVGHIDRASDVINWLDMFLKCRKTFRRNGLLVRSPRRLFLSYISSFTFVLDIIAVVPFELYNHAYPTNAHQRHVYLRMNRMLKFHSFLHFFRRLEMTNMNTNMIGIIRLILIVFLMVHWNACLFFKLSEYEGLGSDSWVYPGDLRSKKSLNQTEQWDMRFIYSFYRSLVLLTTIGDELTPQTTLEMFFVISNSFVGVLIFATIFGQVGNMVKNMNSERNMFQWQRDRVKKYMHLRDVSRGLVDKVMNWFEHTWNTSGVTDAGAIVSCLPEILRTEIAINVNLDSLSKVSLFKDCERGFLIELVLKLKICMFSPGDYVCRHGEIGTSMYIIKSGQVHVVSPTGDFWAALGEGDVFGEVSVINVDVSGVGRRRTANVISLGYSDLFCIEKQDLWEALATYPVAKHLLVEYGRRRLQTMTHDYLDTRAKLVEETKSMPMDAKIDYLIDNVDLIDQKVDALTSTLESVAAGLREQFPRFTSRIYEPRSIRSPDAQASLMSPSKRSHEETKKADIPLKKKSYPNKQKRLPTFANLMMMSKIDVTRAPVQKISVTTSPCGSTGISPKGSLLVPKYDEPLSPREIDKTFKIPEETPKDKETRKDTIKEENVGPGARKKSKKGSKKKAESTKKKRKKSTKKVKQKVRKSSRESSTEHKN